MRAVDSVFDSEAAMEIENDNDMCASSVVLLFCYAVLFFVLVLSLCMNDHPGLSMLWRASRKILSSENFGGIDGERRCIVFIETRCIVFIFERSIYVEWLVL